MTLRTEALSSAGGLNATEALTGGLHSAFAVAAGIAFIALILTLFIRRSSPPEEEGVEYGEAAPAMH
jgi:hypothetical protein